MQKNVHVSTTSGTSTYNYPTGSYIEYKTDATYTVYEPANGTSPSITSNGNYSISGNTMTTTSNGSQPIIKSIQTLDSHSLIMYAYNYNSVDTTKSTVYLTR